MIRNLFQALIALFFLFAQVEAHAKGNGNIQITPDQVKIGLFYSGQKIHIQADISAAYDIVIKVSGMNEDLELKKKGKKGGVLWMNVGELNYHAVPSLFIIRSSHPLKNLASREVLNRLGIGYEALKVQITFPKENDTRSLLGELIKLKEETGLFSVDENALEPTPMGVETTIFLPPKVPPGKYQVEIFGFQNGEGSLLGSGEIKLDFTNAIAFITKLSKEHGLVYGCMASVIAILAGLVTGYIFGDRGKAH